MNNLSPKVKLILPALVTFFFCVNKIDAQKYDWPIEESGTGWVIGDYNTAPVREGYIVKKNGDTLRGLIKFLIYNKYFTYIPILPTGTTCYRNVINVPRNDIKCLRLYKDTVENTDRFADFFNIDNNRDLWRLIASKNDIAIYDIYSLGMKNPYGYTMILVENKQKVLIYDLYWNLFTPTHKAILKFINKRYQTSFNKTYFKTTNEMVNYILSKEVAK